MSDHVVPMDWFRQYDRETLAKLGEAGVRHVLLLENWPRLEPSQGQFTLDFPQYLHDARDAGICVWVIINGGPFWAPNDWHLRNAHGQYNECREYVASEAKSPHHHYVDGPGYVIQGSFLNFWNPEAEAAARTFIAAMRAIIEAEGSTLIPWIGGGEFFMPDPGFAEPRPWTNCDWWYDRYSPESWLKYCYEEEQPTRMGWLHREQSRITKERLALYSEKWLSCIPYRVANKLNTPNLDAILAENAEGLSTIIFSPFWGREAYATSQAQRYPTWFGSEGPFNLLTNAPKAKVMGAAGMLCGLLGPWYGLKTVEPWVYDAIKQVNQAW